MPAKVHYQADADLRMIRSRTIAVLGYGSQGRAHAMNLRDSGCSVVIGQRAGGGGATRAVADGFTPVPVVDAARQGDLIIYALPDEVMGVVHAAEIEPALRTGQALGFIHGFAIRFGQVHPPADVDVILVAPKGPGSLVRDSFLRGGGLTCLIAVHQDAGGHARDLALAWGAAVGGGRGGMIETTFAEECESDLFGEQAVLCGGVIELVKAAYDVLVDAGCPEEVAYFECIHELKQVVDLQYAEGLRGMRGRISNTAAYGGLTRGPRLVTDETRETLRAILGEIRSGRFAEEWIAEQRGGKKRMEQLKSEEAAHPSETAGARVRAMVHGRIQSA